MNRISNPLVVVASQNFQGASSRVHQPRMCYARSRIHTELPVAIEVGGIRGQHLTNPIWCSREVRRVRQRRHPLPSPARDVRHNHGSCQVQLRLVENPPAARSTMAVIEGRTQRETYGRTCAGVSRGWSWRDEEFTVHDFADDMVAQGEDVLVGRRPRRGPRLAHGPEHTIVVIARAVPLG